MQAGFGRGGGGEFYEFPIAEPPVDQPTLPTPVCKWPKYTNDIILHTCG